VTRRGDGQHAVRRASPARRPRRFPSSEARRWQRISFWTLLAGTAALLAVSLLVTGLGVGA
jgi:hypothetical protein